VYAAFGCVEHQAAEFLKCSPQTMRQRAAAGEIPHHTVGGEYRYYVYDLLDYVLGPQADSSEGHLEHPGR